LSLLEESGPEEEWEEPSQVAYGYEGMNRPGKRVRKSGYQSQLLAKILNTVWPVNIFNYVLENNVRDPF
jgi:hypothetical protein